MKISAISYCPIQSILLRSETRPHRESFAKGCLRRFRFAFGSTRRFARWTADASWTDTWHFFESTSLILRRCRTTLVSFSRLNEPQVFSCSFALSWSLKALVVVWIRRTAPPSLARALHPVLLLKEHR
jgi:hypothetical protein